jgi:hypothetical protein
MTSTKHEFPVDFTSSFYDEPENDLSDFRLEEQGISYGVMAFRTAVAILARHGFEARGCDAEGYFEGEMQFSDGKGGFSRWEKIALERQAIYAWLGY